MRRDIVDASLAIQTEGLTKRYGNTLAVDGLQSTVSFWWLDVDSELLFVGDAGITEASRPSRRQGVEWSNSWMPLAGVTRFLFNGSQSAKGPIDEIVHPFRAGQSEQAGHRDEQL